MVQAFINKIAPLIRTEATKRGYKVCSAVIAQAVIESRYGESTLSKKYNNFFGIKCGKAWLDAGKPSVNMKTKEDYGKGLVNINDYFRVYDSMSDCISGNGGYYDFISTKRYANLKTATTGKQYAEFLKADGYATSSTYVKTLTDTINKYNLERWDTDHVEPIPTLAELTIPYSKGNTYVLHSNLYIRDKAAGEKIDFFKVTANAKANGYADAKGKAVLRKGSKVTCKDAVKINRNIWIQIPSGWVCAKEGDKTYIL